MSLVWKLLRQHISAAQLAGFLFANLLGMFIVLAGYQFYRDVLPVFTQGDSFMGADYMILSKKISAGSSLSGRSDVFSDDEIEDLETQEFVRAVGKFTMAGYNVTARMGINGVPVLSSEMFFESVPDRFVDTPVDNWKWKEGTTEVPVILPRSYMTMYNFGFAQTHSLPKISEGLVGLIDFQIFISGNGKRDVYKGKVIGFSSRLNSILVPQQFMDWSNSIYSSSGSIEPSRVIVEVSNPTDETISGYMEAGGYDVEKGNLDAEKTMHFLRMIVSMVMTVGLIISCLSFYILMLSIYLLVQKNESKLENLLLIGYTPVKVALPYQLLTLGLNMLVFLIVAVLLIMVRGYYMDVIEMLYPNIDEGSVLPSLIVGACLLCLVTLFNFVAIWKKIMNVWHMNDRK